MITDELRRNNYVIRSGDILKITSLTATNVNSSIAVSGCTAIPLSEDLLVNQGFILKTTGVLKYGKLGVLSLYPTDVAGTYQWILSENVKLLVSTFHYLQNIFHAVFGCEIAVDEEKLRDSALGHDLDDPENVAESNVLAVTATLSWDAVDNAAGYKITDDDGVTFSDLIEAETVDLTDLTAETEYSYKVKAIAEEGSIYRDSYLSAACEFTTAAVAKLGTPVGMVASGQTGTTAHVAWTAVTNADAYAYSLDDGSTWVETLVETNAVDLTGLTPSTTYKFKVKAKADASGNYSDSDPSAAIDVITTA